MAHSSAMHSAEATAAALSAAATRQLLGEEEDMARGKGDGGGMTHGAGNATGLGAPSLRLPGSVTEVLDRSLKLVHDYAGWGADAVALCRVMLGSLVGKMGATARSWRHDLERPEWAALTEVCRSRRWQS